VLKETSSNLNCLFCLELGKGLRLLSNEDVESIDLESEGQEVQVRLNSRMSESVLRKLTEGGWVVCEEKGKELAVYPLT
jgi:hypothetical protein